MPYAFITLAQARVAVAERLYEMLGMPGPMQFMDPAEIDVYIREALQTFNAIAHFYREEFVFETEPGIPWYDITFESGSLRPLTATDLQLISTIEYHLLEPQTL